METTERFSIFETKEQYQEFRSNFKKWYNEEGNKQKMWASDFALYAAIRGKDWRKCFADNSHETTIASIEMYLMKRKTQYIDLSPFKGITTEQIESLREHGIQKWGEA
jgi:hypothetical protein